MYICRRCIFGHLGPPQYWRIILNYPFASQTIFIHRYFSHTHIRQHFLRYAHTMYAFYALKIQERNESLKYFLKSTYMWCRTMRYNVYTMPFSEQINAFSWQFGKVWSCTTHGLIASVAYWKDSNGVSTCGVLVRPHYKSCETPSSNLTVIPSKAGPFLWIVLHPISFEWGHIIFARHVPLPSPLNVCRAVQYRVPLKCAMPSI